MKASPIWVGLFAILRGAFGHLSDAMRAVRAHRDLGYLRGLPGRVSANRVTDRGPFDGAGRLCDLPLSLPRASVAGRPEAKVRSRDVARRPSGATHGIKGSSIGHPTL